MSPEINALKSRFGGYAPRKNLKSRSSRGSAFQFFPGGMSPRPPNISMLCMLIVLHTITYMYDHSHHPKSSIHSALMCMLCCIYIVYVVLYLMCMLCCTYSYHSKKAMEYERFGNCLTNARQKIRYVFGQNFTDLVYMDRRHSLLTAFVPGSI